MVRTPLVVLAAIAVVALAACGSSGSSAAVDASPPSTSAGSGSGSAPSTTTGGAAAVVTAATNVKLGSVFVDASGRTLYTLTNAAGAPVACTGQCLTFWPPALLPAGATAAALSGSSALPGLGTVAVSGGMQVTEQGAPLYRFSGDAAPGTANGEGISSFGGTWHVVKAAAGAAGSGGAAATTVPPAATPTPTTAAGGGGYGYP